MSNKRESIFSHNNLTDSVIIIMSDDARRMSNLKVHRQITRKNAVVLNQRIHSEFGIEEPKNVIFATTVLPAP